MNQGAEHLHKNQPTSFYTRTWQWLKQFPKILHSGSQKPPATSGPAAAFLISAGIGSASMMVAHHLSDTSKAREAFLLMLGSWIPGSTNPDPMWGNIGSYAGKETVLLISWLVSLAILYPIFRHKQVRPRTLFFWMFSLFTVATVMAWHPLFPYLPLQ
ncbi:hypothetical protein C8255_06910 [filamentous cyanobacterium CCP3]|nr:hypothetical protein C8255_06910 [filamentous cyanobacterium CCP3]